MARNSSAFVVSLRRWWFVLVAAAIAAGVGTFVVVREQTPTYEAETQLLVGPFSGDFDTLEASRQLAVTYADLVTSSRLRAATAHELGIGKLPASDVSAAANDITRLLTIRARNESPSVAASIANTLARSLARLSAVRGKPQGEVQVVDPARPPTHSVAPRTGLLTAVSAFAGLLIGLGLLGVRSLLDGVVREQSQLEDRPDLAFAETIPNVQGPRRAPDQAIAHYRLAIGKIEATRGGRPGLVAVSSTPGGRGALVALGLARSWARAGGRILLIDADELDGGLTRLCRLEGRPGLAEVLRGSDPKLSSAVAVSGGIDVLPRGGEPTQLTEESVRVLLEAVDGFAKPVIVKVGWAAESPGSLAWFAAADASVIVATRDRTELSAITYTAQAMHLAGARTVGALLYVEPAVWLRFATRRVARTTSAALRLIRSLRLPTRPNRPPSRRIVRGSWRPPKLPSLRRSPRGRTVPRAADAPAPIAPGSAPERVTSDRRRLQELIDAGLIRVGSRLRGSSPHGNSWALVRNGGELEFGGNVCASPTEAATKVTGHDTEGLSFWQTRRNNGFISLAKLARMLDSQPSSGAPGEQKPDA